MGGLLARSAWQGFGGWVEWYNVTPLGRLVSPRKSVSRSNFPANHGLFFDGAWPVIPGGWTVSDKQNTVQHWIVDPFRRELGQTLPWVVVERICISSSGSWNPLDQTRTNTELVRLEQLTRFPTPSPPSRMASPVAPPQLSALDAIFQGLRNKSHDVRLRAAEDLKQYVKPSLLSCSSRSAAQGVTGHKCGGRDVLQHGGQDVGRHNQPTSLRSRSQPEHVGKTGRDIGYWCVAVLSIWILGNNRQF